MAAVAAIAETHRYVPAKDDLKFTFATVPPVLHLKPGDRLETWTESALGESLNKPGDRLPADFRPNLNTGPFHIEGAEPGDTLVVKPAAERVAIEATPESLAAGRAILGEVAKALGGGSVATTTALRTEEEVVITMQGQSMALVSGSDHGLPGPDLHLDPAAGGEQIMVIDGNEGFQMTGGQSQTASAEEVQEQRREFGRDLQYVLRYWRDDTLEAIAAGEGEVNGMPCRAVAVRFNGAASNWCVTGDGWLLRKTYQGKHPLTGAPGQFEVLYSDYREAGGRLVPHKSVTRVDGTDLATTTLTAFEVEPEVDPALFEKPAA